MTLESYAPLTGADRLRAMYSTPGAHIRLHAWLCERHEPVTARQVSEALEITHVEVCKMLALLRRRDLALTVGSANNGTRAQLWVAA